MSKPSRGLLSSIASRLTGGGVRFGLSAKLLILAVLLVILAEALIYLPSIASFRRNWLNDRLAAAQIAVLVLEGAAPEGLPAGSESRLLNGVGARAIAARVGGARRLLSVDPVPPEVARTVDLREAGWFSAVVEALAVLGAPARSMPIRVVGDAVGNADFVEMVIDERPLRQAMLTFSKRILLISLLICGVSGILVYLVLNWFIVRPIRRLAAQAREFEADPENPLRIATPTDRADEIGEAEHALARMQASLAEQLRTKKHLAELGLAVSKINHDLRNMLAAAQLMSDQLIKTNDPKILRFAPRLVATLDRAIAFCQATLAYGRAAEAASVLRDVAVRQLVAEASELVGLADKSPVVFVNDVAGELVLRCDPDQMVRVLMNLMRNAVEALQRAGTEAGAKPLLTVEARPEQNEVALYIRDNGPGVPERAKAHLFQAFRGSVKAGGTGLGLAIAAELVRLQGGTIELQPSAVGAVFRIALPAGS